MICVYREYEARIQELRDEFGKEQADKTLLQKELNKLQEEWNDKLMQGEAEVKHLGSGEY